MVLPKKNLLQSCVCVGRSLCLHQWFVLPHQRNTGIEGIGGGMVHSAKGLERTLIYYTITKWLIIFCRVLGLIIVHWNLAILWCSLCKTDCHLVIVANRSSSSDIIPYNPISIQQPPLCYSHYRTHALLGACAYISVGRECALISKLRLLTSSANRRGQGLCLYKQ